ncbi:MAG: type II toxin-antitoxin system HicB family antitoxin [Candidatus Caldarchaeales archaeon]
MELARTTNQQAIDKLIVLYVIDQLRGRGADASATKLQKIVFLIERQLLAEKLSALHYYFIRHRYGPFSRDLGGDLSELKKAGLISKDEKGYFVTEKGKMVLDRMSAPFARNERVIEMIAEKVDEFGKVPLRALLDRVYSARRPLKGKKEPISKVKERTTLLVPRKFEKRLDFREDELTWLRVVTDPDVEELEETTVSGMRVLLVRYRGEKYITAIVPSLPGTVSQGKNKEEAMRNVSEAIELYTIETKAH